jgi:hypothetical protein
MTDADPCDLMASCFTAASSFVTLFRLPCSLITTFSRKVLMNTVATFRLPFSPEMCGETADVYSKTRMSPNFCGRSKGATCMVNTSSTARSEDHNKQRQRMSPPKVECYIRDRQWDRAISVLETPIDTFPQAVEKRTLQLWIVSCYSSLDPYHFAKNS